MASLASYFPTLEGDSGPSTAPTVDTHSSQLPATTSYANRSTPFAHTSPSYQQASHPPLLPLPNPTISTSIPNVPVVSSSLTPSSPIAPLNLSGNLFATLTSLHNSVITLSSSVDSLARQHDVHISTEAMRNNEELRSLRSVLHGLRMQVHSILMERNAQITGRPGGQGMEGQGIAAIDGSPWLPSFGIPRFPHLGVPPPAPVTKL
ncbi:hypothetical protein QCA50_004626 [Cerrena zonata]|uniref:Uncharacterized protein n=1 Tax=Cerrena zonata TaxID=2478898 RepID=A0AAW0GI83_9APHY